MVPATRAGLWLRDLSLRAAPALVRLGARLDPMGVGDASTAIDLPDY